MVQLNTGRHVTVESLQKFLGKTIIVNYRAYDGDEHLADAVFEGKVRAVSDAGVALTNRNTTKLFEIDDIVDFEPVVRQRRVQRRRLRTLTDTDQSVRQHLADRHAIPIDVLNAVDEATARLMHDRIDHDKLGHVHVTKDEQADELDKLGEDPDYEDD